MSSKTYTDEEKGITKNFKHFDYFGVTIPFRLDNHKYHSSLLGAIVFYIFVLCIFAFGLYNFIIFAQYTNYSIVNTESKVFNPQLINFNNYNLTLAVGISFNNLVDLDLQNKYFKIKLFYKELNRTDNTLLLKEIPMERNCTIEDFSKYNISENDINQFYLQQFLCPKLTTYSISGQYVDKFYSYFKIQVEMVDLLTDNDRISAERLFRSNDIKLQIFYNDVSLKLDEYENTIKYFLNQQFINLGYYDFKKMNVFFMESKVVTDYNPLASSEGVEIKFLKVKETYEYFQTFGQNRFNLGYLQSDNKDFNKTKDYDEVLNILGVMYLRESEYISYTKKTYYKFIEFIADTSSILQMIFIIFFIIIRAINNFKAYETLVTRTMKFKGNLQEQDKVDFEKFYEVFKKGNRKRVDTKLKSNQGNEGNEEKDILKKLVGENSSPSPESEINANIIENSNIDNEGLKYNKLEQRIDVKSDAKIIIEIDAHINKHKHKNEENIELADIVIKEDIKYNTKEKDIDLENKVHENNGNAAKVNDIKNTKDNKDIKDIKDIKKNNENKDTKDKKDTKDINIFEGESIKGSTSGINILASNAANTNSVNANGNIKNINQIEIQTKVQTVGQPGQANSETQNKLIANSDDEISPSYPSKEDFVKYSYSEICINLLRTFFFKMFCLKMCCEKNQKGSPDYNKNLLLKKSKKKLYYYIDIVTYFKKMQELDILKYILLDSDQLKLLNFVSKPIISKTKDDIFKIVNENNDNNNLILDKEEIEHLFKSYVKLNHSETLTNEKLIRLVNHEIDVITEEI